MKISYQWLCEFVPELKKIDPKQLAKEFTQKSFEVEKIIEEAKLYENMVVGRIEGIRKHPNADKLLLVDTNIGKKTIQIVCGCLNLEVGQFVFVALPDASVKWHGEGDFVKLKETEIRGEKSFGMICTASEVGLQELLDQKNEKDACILNFLNTDNQLTITAGTSISETLGFNDIIFDVDNKTLTNRPDLWGHIGLAREAAAIFQKKFIYKPSLLKIESGKEKFSVIIKNPKACIRYSGALINNMKVEASPFLMRKRLWSLSVRPINNIVDITNYVMLEIGQPMHVFDAVKFDDKKIVVDTLEQEKSFLGLDNHKYLLPAQSIVIMEGKNIEALGGILGGKSSEVNMETTSCFFEAANFDGALIRTTSLQLGLRTDASARHEKNLDPYATLLALERAIMLLRELCPTATISSKIIDIKKTLPSPRKIFLSHEMLEKKIGIAVKTTFIENTLRALGFQVSLKKQKPTIFYEIAVPSFRAAKDIILAEDIIEEIVRIYGYDKIPSIFPLASIKPQKMLSHLQYEREIKNIFSRDFGFTEIYLYPFEDEKIFSLVGYNKENAVEIKNALQQDLRFLKQDLLPGLLRTIRKNEGILQEGKIYELGRVFHRSKKMKDGLPNERRMLAFAVFGMSKNFQGEMKGILELFFKKIGAENNFYFSAPIRRKHYWCSEENSVLYDGKEEIGFYGKVSKEVSQFFHLKHEVWVAQIDFCALIAYFDRKKIIKSLPKFPALELDISFIVSREILWYNILETIKTQKEDWIEDIIPFDVFESSTLGEKEKSIAFRIRYRHPERTLSLEEVMPIQQKIIQMLEEKFHGKVRI